MTTHDSSHQELPETAPSAVTIERVSEALTELGIVPFTAAQNQIAILLNNRTFRFVLFEGRSAEGIAAWPRLIHACHESKVARSIAAINSRTYLPKIHYSISDNDQLVVQMHHTFNWSVGATDKQLIEELRHFIVATLTSMNSLDDSYPDPWTREEHNA